jgi:hypothetical protein
MEGWAAVFAATYLSWRLWTGAGVSDDQRAALAPLG